MGPSSTWLDISITWVWWLCSDDLFVVVKSICLKCSEVPELFLSHTTFNSAFGFEYFSCGLSVENWLFECILNPQPKLCYFIYGH